MSNLTGRRHATNLHTAKVTNMRFTTWLRVLLLAPCLGVSAAEFRLAYDVGALPLPHFRSHIVEAGARFGDWRVFVAPEWIHRDYDAEDLLVVASAMPPRRSNEEGFGFWTGVDLRPRTAVWTLLGMDTARGDLLRPLRVGLYGRGRMYRARRTGEGIIASTTTSGGNVIWNGSTSVTNRRTEDISTLALGCAVAYTLGPFMDWAGERRVTLEPYVRTGFGKEWITTTVLEGDRVPGTTREDLWSRDFRMGALLGWGF